MPIRVTGADVAGPVDLRGERSNVVISLRDSRVPGGFLLDNAMLAGLDLSGCVCGGITGKGLHVSGSLLLKAGFVATRRIDLSGGSIAGELDCRDAKFGETDGVSLELVGARVERRVIMTRAQFGGRVRMTGAWVGGDVNVSDAEFARCPDQALTLDGIRIGGRLLVRRSAIRGTVSAVATTIAGPADFSSSALLSGPTALNLVQSSLGSLLLIDTFSLGRVVVVRARVGGRVALGGAKIANPGRVALTLRGANVSGDVSCGGDFWTEGAVSVYGARISGDLDLHDTDIGADADGVALFAGGCRVGGSVFLHEACFDGDIQLWRAAIEGDLNCWRTELEGVLELSGCSVRWLARFDGVKIHSHSSKAVSASAMRVGGRFAWHGVGIHPPGTVSLREATFGYLDDDVRSCEAPGSFPVGDLVLHGLRYQSLSGIPASAGLRREWTRARIEWLRGQESSQFSVQPYRQVAGVLSSLGYDKEATAVLIASEHDRANQARMTFPQRAIRRPLRLVGYGYRPGGAVAALLCLVLLGTVVFAFAHRSGALLPRRTHSPFSAPAYSLDVSLPFVDLRQDREWRLAGGIGWSIYYWIHVLLAWVLATLAVLALTGTIRRADGRSAPARAP